jgi:hypothetical protein
MNKAQLDNIMPPCGQLANSKVQICWLVFLSLSCGIFFACFAETFRHSWDAYTHLFFADHYLKTWFNLYEPRWFTGFSVAAYPPAAHQILAFLVALCGGPERGLKVMLVAVHLLFVLGVYRWVRTLTDQESAFCAALLALVIPSFYVGLHAFGQVPFLFSVSLCLHTVAETQRYLQRNVSLVRPVCAAVAAVSSHHITAGLFLLPLLLILIFQACGDKTAVRDAGRRMAAVFVCATSLSLLALGALLLWVQNELVAQVEIPHPSRDNFLHSAHARSVFFWPMFGVFLPFLPLALLAIKHKSRWMPLAGVLLFMLLMGLGGTTPLPRIIFGSQWRWMTYDRFQIFATLLLLPLLSPVIVSCWREISNPGASWLRRRAYSSVLCAFIAISITGVFYSANLALIQQAQPIEIDFNPLAGFLNSSQRSQWRYLTLGFGERISKLSYLTSAQSIDGQYFTGRTLPELTQSGIGLLDRSFDKSALLPFLLHPERYHLRWLFLAPWVAAPYGDLLAGHWILSQRLPNGVLVLEPLQKVAPLPQYTDFGAEFGAKELFWGIIPFGCFSLLLGFWIGDLVFLLLKINVDGYESSKLDGGAALGQTPSFRLVLALVFSAALGLHFGYSLHRTALWVSKEPERVDSTTIFRAVIKEAICLQKSKCPSDLAKNASADFWFEEESYGDVGGVAAPLVKRDYLFHVGSEFKYRYSYGSSKFAQNRAAAQRLREALFFRIKLDASTYSGSRFAFQVRDLREIRSSAKLVFWARGASGKERFLVGLGSESASHTIRSRVAIPPARALSTKWQKIEIPLSSFPDLGYAWDGKKSWRLPLDWSRVIEFEISHAPTRVGGKNLEVLIGPVWLEGS